jgi:hypothetical protein
MPIKALHTSGKCSACHGHAPKRWPSSEGPWRRQAPFVTRAVSSSSSSSSDDALTPSSLSEIAALDQLIDLLLRSSGQQELTKLVAENLLAFDRQFWFRLATRADGATSATERETLTNLANVRCAPLSLALPVAPACIDASSEPRPPSALHACMLGRSETACHASSAGSGLAVHATMAGKA